MLELAILGFLREEPQHGYELKQRIAMLAGHFRPPSAGALYPAIARLEAQGLISRHVEPGSVAAPRQVLSLTPAGEASLLERLRKPDEIDISDRNHFFTLLAFLKYLTVNEQRTILERRLAFIEGGRSFFQKAGRPVPLKQESDPYRRGMILLARETSRIEKAWLLEMLASL